MNKSYDRFFNFIFPNRKNKRLNKVLLWISHYQHIFWILCIAAILVFLLITIPAHIWKEIWHGLKTQSQFIGLGLLFCIVAISLIWSFGQRIDVWGFLLFNKAGPRPRWLDLMMLCFTQAGNFIFALLVTAAMYIGSQQILAYELILGVLTLGLVVQTMKVFIRRTRPYNAIPNMRIVGARNGGHSFPSGHTSQAFFMASLLAHYYQLGVGITILLYASAVLVGITRIYVGMHYPRDVIGGSILGTAWGILGVFVNSTIFDYLKIY